MAAPQQIPQIAQPFPPVAPGQRHTQHNLCPVCLGGDNDRRGHAIRCYGFTSDDGRYAFCTREEYAGSLSRRDDSLYKHLLDGPCRCGIDHSTDATPAPRSAPSAPSRKAPSAPTRAHLASAPDATYSYRALDSGAPLRKLRYGSGKGKRFVWQRAEAQDGIGGWGDCRGDRPTPDAYRAETLADADPWAPVFITEGEKDCDKVRAVGGVAISPPDGAGSWRDTYSPHVAGRQVVICADDDADGTGLRHAEKVAASVAPYVVSVRILLFTPAHDVGDWLDAGHTFAELRTLAATTPAITVQLPPALNTSPARQDDASAQSLKSCLNCQRAEERARIAEASLANLRREQAIRARILAAPKEQLSPAQKATLIATREVLSHPRAPRDASGLTPVYRAQIAQKVGVSEQTVGEQLAQLAQKGILRRDVVKDFTRSEIRIAEGPLYDQPEQIAVSEKTWGGRRVKLCTTCGSANLEVSVVCRDCGTVQSRDDVNTPAEDDDSDAPTLNYCPARQDDAPEEWVNDAGDDDPTRQDDFPPPSLFIVRHLAVDPESEVSPDEAND